MDLVIDVDDPRADDVAAVLASHLAFANATSPAEHVHAFDARRLQDPAVMLFSARRAGDVLGVGALKHLDADHVEIKSMHVAATARGQGVGRALVDALLREATRRGYRRVSLETGTMEAFAPARSMYARAGFIACEPFGDYTVNPHSTCMTRTLPAGAPPG